MVFSKMANSIFLSNDLHTTWLILVFFPSYVPPSNLDKPGLLSQSPECGRKEAMWFLRLNNELCNSTFLSWDACSWNQLPSCEEAQTSPRRGQVEKPWVWELQGRVRAQLRLQKPHATPGRPQFQPPAVKSLPTENPVIVNDSKPYCYFLIPHPQSLWA